MKYTLPLHGLSEMQLHRPMYDVKLHPYAPSSEMLLSAGSAPDVPRIGEYSSVISIFHTGALGIALDENTTGGEEGDVTA